MCNINEKIVMKANENNNEKPMTIVMKKIMIIIMKENMWKWQ